MINDKRLSDAAAQNFHNELNAGDFELIYSQSSDQFRNSDSKAKILKFFQAIHTKLGNEKSGEFQSIHVNATTSGTYITVSYFTTFEKGKAQETFVWGKAAGQMVLYGYNVRSNALIEN